MVVLIYTRVCMVLTLRDAFIFLALFIDWRTHYPACIIYLPPCFPALAVLRVIKCDIFFVVLSHSMHKLNGTICWKMIDVSEQ